MTPRMSKSSPLDRIADFLDQHKIADYRGRWSVAVAFGVMIPVGLAKEIYRATGRTPARTGKPLGSCRTCKFSIKGRDRGWSAPCVSCSRPEMTNWKRKRPE